jgi:hypothetical protein
LLLLAMIRQGIEYDFPATYIQPIRRLIHASELCLQ